MRILCKLKRHTPMPNAIWNAGHSFTRCGGCGCDLIRGHAGEWHTPPRGYAVVWKPRSEREMRWEDCHDLPLPMAARADLRNWVKANRLPIAAMLH